MRYRPPKHSESKVNRREDDPFVRVFFHIPKYIYNELEVLSKTVNVSVSRLVGIALFKELHCEGSFSLDLALPVDDFSEGNHPYEAAMLKEYLLKIPSGASLDVLMLLCPMIGLKPKELLLGYMELKRAGLVEEYRPKDTAIAKYPEDCKYIRLRGVSYHEFQKHRFRTLEGKAVRTRKD